MDDTPGNSRFLPALMATILFLLPFNGLAGIQDDFFRAVDKGQVSQVSKLLNKGANPDIPNTEGYI